MRELLRLAAVAALVGSHAATKAHRSDPWVLHDPDFPVQVTVAPFADDQWDAEVSSAADPLAIPSSVLNLSVALPPVANVTSTNVFVTLFRENDDDADANAFIVLADSQLHYGSFYRLDVGATAQAMVMRVYIESQLASGRIMRAQYVRSLDLSPSEPFYINCDDAAQPDIALRLTSFPPTNMPMDLCDGYTMGGRVPIRKWYFDDRSDPERTYEERSFEFIEDLVEKARGRKRFYYGATDDYLHAALDKYPVRGKHVLIIGSTMPWYEAICVAQEAASCTTIDYNQLRYHHPKIQTYTVGEFETAATRRQFDVIFSISSFEHDGLGRYGDSLDPTADLKAMSGLQQYTKDASERDTGTRIFLAVPVGADAIVWNAQRIYGPLRLPLLLQDWTLVESFGFSTADFAAPFTVGHQPLFVLEPKFETSSAGVDRSEL